MADPHIKYIDPSTVKQNTAATIKIIGSNFYKDIYVSVDNASPIYKYVSSTELTVELKTQDTKIPGNRAVKVHNLDDGSLSNEVTLTIV